MIRPFCILLVATFTLGSHAHAFDLLPRSLFPQKKVDASKKLQWTRMEVPGTRCADGSTYPVFINNEAMNKNHAQRSKKLMFVFQGGGVCFDRSTCEGINLTAPDKVVPYESDIGSIDGQGVFTTDSQFNKFKNYTKVYFPYCTGDVFIGSHTAHYRGLTVRHHGQTNIEKSIDFIKKRKQLLNFNTTSEVILYGFSAGAIGALNHITTFTNEFPNASRKTLIADAPGLHFAETFWQSFSPEFLRDARKQFRKFNYELNPSDGLIAPLIPKLCDKHRDWNIGVLQATMDVAMIFYGQHQDEQDHEDMVLGPRGLPKMTENPNDNCSSWVEMGIDNYGLPGQEPGTANEFNHTYLISNDTSVIRVDGISAIDYAVKLTQGAPVRNYLGVTERPDHVNLGRQIVSTR